jgi:DNA invertase Pin-like site-specific DNA recombinase
LLIEPLERLVARDHILVELVDGDIAIDTSSSGGRSRSRSLTALQRELRHRVERQQEQHHQQAGEGIDIARPGVVGVGATPPRCDRR